MLSEKVHMSIPKGIVGGFEFIVFHCFSKKFERMARETMDVCMQVLKGSNESRLDCFCQCQQQCIDHIPCLPSGIVACTLCQTTFLKIVVTMR